MSRELFTVIGDLDTNTGIFNLYSDLFYVTDTVSAPKYIQIPYGMKAKIWARRCWTTASNLIFSIEYSDDVTRADSVFRAIDTVLVSEGHVELDKKRPVIIHSFTGKEGFRITARLASGDLLSGVQAQIMLEVEIVDDDS